MAGGQRPRAPLASSDVRVTTLEGLLAIRATERSASLREAAQLLAATFAADKVDVFLYDPATETLVADGTSDTPMGREQHRLGLQRLPLANGGSAVRVFQTGEPHLTRQADQEGELPGLVHGLGIRAEIIAPVHLAGVRRGVVLASSRSPDYFAEEHLDFLGTVARWVGLVAERAELTQRLAEEAAARERRTAAEELIAVLAHDLRNRLSAVRGRLDLLKQRAHSRGHPEYARDAQAALAAVDRLGKLVDDLLDSERLERGLFTLRPEAVDLVALARDTAESFGAEGLKLVLRAPDELWLPADPARLRQCLDNLVSNAVTHSPSGGQVTIEVAAARQGGVDGARLSVQDEGPGVPPELVPRLFERFARGTRSGGLGLGLFLANRIALAHAGTLTLDSPPGVPAHFSLWLPISAPA